MEIPEQQRSIVSEVTLIDAMAAGPCSQEVRTAGKLRVRQKGSCHGYLEGNFVYKFDGTEEVFDADGNPDSTLVGTYTRLPNGERESQGTRTFHKTGVVFNGTDNGSVSTGTVTFKTGGSTRCTFTKGKANGSDCELRYPDGGIYRGALADDRPTGRGVMSFSSGGSFEGDFREGKFWGQGVLAFADGRKIIGGFIAGKADGDVVLVSKDGVRTTAHFVAGERDR